MDVQAFVPKRTVKSLDEGIVRWLSGATEVKAGTVVVSPHVHQPAGEFGTVIGKQILGFAALRHEPIQCHHHILSDWLAHLNHAIACMRARVEHPFRVIRRQFGYTKVCYRSIAKNTAQLNTLFALSNLWMARRTLLVPAGEVRP